MEAQNRDLYYKVVSDLNSEVQGKIGAIIQLAADANTGGKKRGGGTAEEIKARQALLNRYNVNRDQLQLVLRTARRDTGLFGPRAS